MVDTLKKCINRENLNCTGDSLTGIDFVGYSSIRLLRIPQTIIYWEFLTHLACTIDGRFILRYFGINECSIVIAT